MFLSNSGYINIKIWLILIIFTSFWLLSSEYTYCIANNLPKESIAMDIPKKNVTNEDRYKNTFTAQSCIKVVLLDHKTGQTINVIFGNEQFARILAEKRGLIDKRGILKDGKAYINFLKEDFLEFMVKHDGKPINIDIDTEEIKKNFSSFIFDRPMTFEQLNVKSEIGLLDKYFDFDYSKGSGTLKGEYYEKYTRNPAFIALLIDLGYDVVWGDYVPNLNIYTEPFISTLENNPR